MQDVLRYIDENRDRFIGELVDWVRIPSISTLSAHREDCARAARWLAEKLESIGLNARLIETRSHPIVEAVSSAEPDIPTLMIYGHYDVQPVDPLSEWRHDPFAGAIEGDDLVARGASDDKGQVMVHVAALEAWLRTGRPLPARVVFAVEGNEEGGPTAMETYAEGRARELAPAAILVSDTSQLAEGKPAITYGLRGIVYLKVRLRTASSDLHSGSHGGPAPNAARALVELLGRLHNPDGSVNVPEFYRDVLEPSNEERRQLEALEIDEEEYRKSIGVRGFEGEGKYSVLERRWVRPTLEINGISSGFTGEGAKTVIPAEAHADLSARLVGNQDPRHISRKIKERILAAAPSHAEVSVEIVGEAHPLLVSRESPYIEAAREAIREGFDAAPAFVRAGGSIPIVGSLAAHTGAPVVMVGFSRPEDHAHGPNEFFNLTDFHKAVRSMVHFWDRIARMHGDGEAKA